MYHDRPTKIGPTQIWAVLVWSNLLKQKVTLIKTAHIKLSKFDYNSVNMYQFPNNFR